MNDLLRKYDSALRLFTWLASNQGQKQEISVEFKLLKINVIFLMILTFNWLPG